MTCRATATWSGLWPGRTFTCDRASQHRGAHHGQGLWWWTYGNGRTAKRACARACCQAGAAVTMVGRTYWQAGQPVVVVCQWRTGAGKGGPRNVLVQLSDGSRQVRPARGLRTKPPARQAAH